MPGNLFADAMIDMHFSGSITTIYGPASSGKTTACMMVAGHYAKTGKVVYIDTENGFNLDRFGQISQDSRLIENLLLLRIKSFDMLQAKVQQLEGFASQDRIKLIIIDSIGNHYRVSVNDEPKKTNDMFVQMMRALVHMTRDHNKAVLLANQVYSKMQDGEVEPVGGKLLKKFCKNLIELNFDGDNHRYAILRKGGAEEDIGMKIHFSIAEKGIVDA